MIKDLDKYIIECINNIEKNSKYNEGNDLYEYLNSLYIPLNSFDFIYNKKKKNKFDDGINLYESLNSLFIPLKNRAHFVTKDNYDNKKDENIYVPSFLKPYEKESEMDKMNENLKLQKPFYIFIIQVLSSYLHENKEKAIDNPKDKKKKSNAYKAGLAFIKLLKKSSKYNLFLSNFYQYFNNKDISNISYSFLYEYIYFSKLVPNHNLSGIDPFLIMEQFYGIKKKLNINKVINDKKEELKQCISNLIVNQSLAIEKIQLLKNFGDIYKFTYDEFDIFYKEHLKANIPKEHEKKNFYLNKNILEYYIKYCNDNNEQLLKIFKLIDNENNIKEEQNEIKINVNKGKKEDDKNKEIIENNKIIEINDLIEKHLIIEKYFSTYDIIKFAFLNVIAMTINMKNKQINNTIIIKSICDFCKITNSLVNRYMDIYINIFSSMKLNNLLGQQQCDECINIIKSYLKNTNKLISKSELYNSNDQVKVDDQTLYKFKSEKNDIRERRAEFYKKLDKTKEEQLIFYIEKVFIGSYLSLNNKLISSIEFFAKKYGTLYANLTKKNDAFIPKTPLELYVISNKYLFKFLSNYSFDEYEYIDIGTFVLNLLFYFKMEFFLNKWSFKINNDINEDNEDNIKEKNYDEVLIKNLVIDIIYILLDLYETIIKNNNQ